LEGLAVLEPILVRPRQSRFLNKAAVFFRRLKEPGNPVRVFPQAQSRNTPMNDFQPLHVHYDYRSKTALVECDDRSHVLAELFEDNESANQAALRYAVKHWGYRVPAPTDDSALYPGR
jgi:hypothetical protein